MIDITALPKDFQGLLLWIAGAGGPAIVAALLTLVAENWPKWHTLPRWVKIITPMVVSVLLAVGANVLSSYTNVVSEINPTYQMILSASIAWIYSQKTYTDYKLRGYAEKANPVNVIDATFKVPDAEG